MGTSLGTYVMVKWMITCTQLNCIVAMWVQNQAAYTVSTHLQSQRKINQGVKKISTKPISVGIEPTQQSENQRFQLCRLYIEKKLGYAFPAGHCTESSMEMANALSHQIANEWKPSS